MRYINQKLEEFEKYLYNKKVAIIDIEINKLPLLDYFSNKGAKVTVFDKRTIDEIDKPIIDKITSRCINFSFGEHSLINLVGFDIIFRSPSCRPDTYELNAESLRGAIVTSELEMFLELCPGKLITVIGNDGKTTTANLIYNILKENNSNCYLGGTTDNILFTDLYKITSDSMVVLELNNTELINVDISPEVAVITNVTQDNYPNIYKSYEEYILSIKNIFKNQKETGLLVLNFDNSITTYFASESSGKVVFFSAENKLDNGVIYDKGIIKSCIDGVRRHIISIDEAISLYGKHNYGNICAAVAATSSLVDPSIQARAITKFKDVEHRLEFVKRINDIKWYNDATAINPIRTIAGLNSFKEDIVLIMGGNDLTIDYTQLSKLICDKVTQLILIGKNAEIIEELVRKELEINKKKLYIHKCTTLEECVNKAYEVAKENEIVLFSPSNSNIELNNDYINQGEKFKELINSIVPFI
ncbi:MAG: UDP-N-acetylmuramoyl-L-alanine--D-glutamate ligase [Clostridiales bacterium]|nr:UDP-N-acetylmuramoyl-L-alanine--D-glutamate ligase [Clostridiales bacterium]